MSAGFAQDELTQLDQILTRYDFHNRVFNTLDDVLGSARAEVGGGNSNVSLSNASSLAPLAAPRITPHPAINEALCDLHEAFASVAVSYAIHGSCAALMHGATVKPPPQDIDVIINSGLMNACNALRGPTFARIGGATAAARPVTGLLRITPVRPVAAAADRSGPSLVYNFQHSNGTAVQLVSAEEFGALHPEQSRVYGVAVLSTFETMKNLLTRPERNEGNKKESVAFATMAVSGKYALTTPQQEEIIGLFSPNETISWEEMVKRCKGIIQASKAEQGQA
ncbi:MAG TPA: hypothetical protein VK633_00825 [Verrucomicrobiae bacterium]|nr:hypothetical protein [Verrucomicrobiae bacterium]